MGLTDRFLDIVFKVRRMYYSPKVDFLVRTYLADTVGVTLAGASDIFQKEEAILSLQGSVGNVRPIGHTRTCSIADAIFINGISSHFLELDDGVRYGVIHPSAPLFSALIPLAIAHNIKWEDFLRGAVCGYETSIRIASAIQPFHYSAGYHPTATCCTLGVAVGVAIMLGWEDAIVKDALSAACVSACGSLKVLEDVSQLKPYNCGKAALNGYMSAIMAKAGFAGPSEPLDGDTGFLRMMASSFNEEILVGERNYLCLEKIYQKPYASCRHTHPEIEACFKIRMKEGFCFDQIDSVKVTTYKGVIGKHDFKDIRGESSARMSIPFSVAVALATGKAGIAEFAEPYVSDYALLELTQKVEIVPSEDLSRLVPDKRVAVVEVMMNNGRVFSETVEYPKGEPENPLSSSENYEKFLSMAVHAGLSEQKAESIFTELTEANEPNFNVIW